MVPISPISTGGKHSFAKGIICSTKFLKCRISISLEQLVNDLARINNILDLVSVNISNLSDTISALPPHLNSDND